MSYSFRCLSSADLGALKELLAVFGEAFGDIDTYQGAIPSDRYLRALLEKSQCICVVALSDGRVVGGLAAYILEKFERERREIYIYDLAVLEAHRRAGVATGCIQTLQTVAGERGAYVIFVQADPPDEPAVRLYESLGTREDVYHFDIPVR